MTCSTTIARQRTITDQEYIAGLKAGNPQIVNAFFYGLCSYTLNDIRHSLLRGRVDYDEMVSELYIYLSERNWHRLDTFGGVNGCSLRSWMVRVSWRYFLQQRDELECGQQLEINEQILGDGADTSLSAEIAMDVESTLSRMPNERYAQILRLMLIQGYSADDVAAMLETSAANVYNIKHRAIMQFVDTYSK